MTVHVTLVMKMTFLGAAADGPRPNGLRQSFLIELLFDYGSREIRQALSDLRSRGIIEKCGSDRYRLTSLSVGKEYARNNKPGGWFFE